ncbi:MAG TPA: Ig-like domain-containing protein [Vicinamibacterales bacterium]
MIRISCVLVFVCVCIPPSPLNAQSPLAPWVTGDVGAPAAQGSAVSSNGTFRVTAAAGDIGSQGDQFTFVQQKLTGDGVIVARVRAPQKGDALAKAGVMIRESLDPRSPHVFALATGSGAVRFQRRRVAGGGTVRTNAGAGTAPWLKVERHGATFTAFRSSDGSTWREIGTDIIPMADTVLVGLAVTGGATPTATTADFSTVSVATTAALAATGPPAGWSSADVGLPALAGSETENAGTFSVTGGGIDVAGVSDQFHYVYQQVSGDVNIIARVTAVQLVNAATKGGAMIRDSLTPNGAHASMFMTAGNGLAFVQRSAAGGVATSTSTGMTAAPYWLKLELRADTVTAFQSADGATWATVGAVRLALPTPYFIGLAVSSQDAQSLATATFDNVLISAPSAQNQPPTISLTAPDTSIPYTEPETITIAAAAADADGTISSVDFFQGGTLLGSTSTAPYSFTWSNVPAGSYTFSAIARDNGGAATTSDARSVNVAAPANQPPTVSMTSPADGALFTAPATITLSADASDADGGISRVDFFAGSTLVGSATAAPYSVTWRSVAAGTYSLTAVATDTGGATTTSAARSITVNQRPTVSLTAPANGTTFKAPATIVVSANASDADGTIAKVTFSAGSTVIGTDTTSPYSVTWSNVPAGTYTLRATATDNRGATRNSATRTITVANNQAPTVSLTNPADGATYTAPATITVDATASDADGTIAKVDFFAGSTLIGSTAASPYSVTWNNVPAGSYALTAIATDNDGASISSAARNVTVTGSTAPPAPWTAADIGAPALAGSTQYSNGTFAIDASGADIWGTSDQFRYVYQQFTGDIDIRAHVVSLENTQPWAKGGLMMRETLAANAAHTSLVVTGANGTLFFQRATAGDVTSGPPAGGAGAPLWLRLERHGTAVTGSSSTDGTTWTVVSTSTMATPTMFIGLIVTSHDNTQLATSVIDNVAVNTPANQPPTVSLTAPADAAAYKAPATVVISASASDADGSIAGVDFYAGSTLLGSATSSPYSFTWSNVAAGTYSLTAVARDNAGATATSAARSITVSNNQPPTVSLTAPANGATFTAPATVAMSATASDADGAIARVDFFAGTTLVGTATASPYNFTWNNVPAGTYSLTAVARDDSGATTTSAARTVTVNSPPNQAPTVSLTAPASGATFTAPASITVSATAGDADGTVSNVDFFAGTTLIGTDTTSPYSITWNNVGAGSYSLTAVATDNVGATTTSAARTITVTSTAPPAPWTAADIGTPSQPGSTQYANGTFTVRSTGEVGGTADQFHFVYQPVTGDIDIRARVASIEAVQPWSKAGVMVRETLAPGSIMGMMFISGSSGSAFHQRLSTGAARVSTTGTAVAAPYWLRLERRGTTLTASQSADGTTWAPIGTMTVSASAIYVGLAVASADAAQLATGVLDSVLVTTPPPTPNQAPAVSLTAPANGATFTAPASITVSATASDTDGTIARVDFFAGTTMIGSDTTSPYSITWNNVPAGTYSITAVATDNGGAATTSAARTVTVSAPPPPVTGAHATFTASADHNTLVTRYVLDIFASGADPNTATPIASQDLGKPAVVNGDCTADISPTYNGLAAGSYIATVSAVGSGGSSRSPATPFTK